MTTGLRQSSHGVEPQEALRELVFQGGEGITGAEVGADALALVSDLPTGTPLVDQDFIAGGVAVGINGDGGERSGVWL